MDCIVENACSCLYVAVPLSFFCPIRKTLKFLRFLTSTLLNRLQCVVRFCAARTMKNCFLVVKTLGNVSRFYRHAKHCLVTVRWLLKKLHFAISNFFYHLISEKQERPMLSSFLVNRQVCCFESKKRCLRILRKK